MKSSLCSKALALALLLASCAGQQSSESGPTGIASTSMAASGDTNYEEYKIAANDTLQFNVYQVPDLARTVQVNGSGFITLPLIGRTHVSGKTADQAQQDIAQKLGSKYLQSPQVSISVVKSGQRVTVNGAVRSPAVLTIDGRLTLSQAIAQAGGVSELANSERVHVARLAGQQVNDNVVDLDAIQSGKAADLALQGGDIVVVENSNAKVAFKNAKDLLGFAVLGSILSDIRVKRDIVQLARLEDGIGVYRYKYIWSDTLYVGVMAQEVAEIVPHAVTRGADGYLRVDYRQLGLRFQTWDEWQLGSNSRASSDH